MSAVVFAFAGFIVGAAGATLISAAGGELTLGLRVAANDVRTLRSVAWGLLVLAVGAVVLYSGTHWISFLIGLVVGAIAVALNAAANKTRSER